MAVTRHPPIRDQIADTLRAAIVNLDFAPGELLVERHLCELTQASRPSVREALRQLEAEGLVESCNGRGTIVRVISVEEALEVYEVRAELEGLGAHLFTQRSSTKEREDLANAVTALEKATQEDGSSTRILNAQATFYHVLFVGSKNHFLERTVQGMQTRIAQLRATTLSVPERAQRSLEDFQEIAACIAASDADAARRAAVVHIRSASEAMMRARAQAPSP